MNKKMMATYLLFLFIILSLVNLSSSQLQPPRNIETFYPLPIPPPPGPPAEPPSPAPAEPPEFAPNPAPADSPELAPNPAPAESPDFVPNPTPAESPEFLPIIPPPSPPSLSSKKAIVTAVSATAASAFVLAAVFFLLLTRFSRKRRRNETGEGRDGRPPPVVALETRSELRRFDSGDGKGYVDEDGLDVMYWKKLKSNSSQPATVPRTRSSTSHGQLRHGETAVDQRSSFSSPPPLETQSEPEVAPPPPPSLPLPPPIPVKNSQMPPPPPPSKSAAPPPKPPPPLGGKKQQSEAVGSGSDHVKLKPLHWEKVNIARDHSNVWDKVERGSFQYNGDMMEALFGVAANKRNPSKEENSIDNGESSINNARIFILDQRKSQNVAIVIKSLGVPRDDLIEGLLEGKGLSAESLEKLSRMAPTKEEASEIVAFNGDLSKLADAEFFLYSLLKAVPTTFTRANEMLFRFNYDSEIHNLKESLQTMELACSELKSHGIFLKLLEAILKAGNRLNAGTSRGNAKSFNLTTLRKLSDYKSSDGKSTLLHFVVHEVVRNEGKRCVLMRSRSIGRQSGSSSPQPENSSAKEELEKEYLRLGLPVVGGLSSEFSHVKKSANIDYDAFKSSLGSLASRVGEATELVANSDSVDEGGGFLKEMKNFLVSAEMEIKQVQEEHSRVMEEVKKTTHYYQARSSNDRSPLQLFAIVKDFLSMVDLACVEIARTVQMKRQAKPESGSGSGSTNSDALHVNFAGLPKNFMSDKSSSSSSDDDR